MQKPSNLPKRKRLRLKDYDYSLAGGYFVTICTQNKIPLFGSISDGIMQANRTGEVVSQAWSNLTKQFDCIQLDAFVVMPNHFHGIIIICEPSHAVGAGLALPDLGRIVGTFKSISTIEVNRIQNSTGKKLWQRNYYEHIIRDDAALERIREYIETNPQCWQLDRENPEKKGSDQFDVWINSFSSNIGLKPLECCKK